MSSLVPLKLYNVSVFGILNNASVAIKLLFAFLQDDLLVDLRINPLHRCQALTPVSLLHANVNVVVLHGIRGFLLFLFRLVFVAKVKRFVSKRVVRCARQGNKKIKSRQSRIVLASHERAMRHAPTPTPTSSQPNHPDAEPRQLERQSSITRSRTSHRPNAPARRARTTHGIPTHPSRARFARTHARATRPRPRSHHPRDPRARAIIRAHTRVARASTLARARTEHQVVSHISLYPSVALVMG